jgi:Rieske Fe-S protein
MNNSKTRKPTAIHKDGDGKTHSFSALCPHMKEVMCWNRTEMSWGCPVHSSRFSKDGACVIGPAKGDVQPMDESGTDCCLLGRWLSESLLVCPVPNTRIT